MAITKTAKQHKSTYPHSTTWKAQCVSKGELLQTISPIAWFVSLKRYANTKIRFREQVGARQKFITKLNAKASIFRRWNWQGITSSKSKHHFIIGIMGRGELQYCIWIWWDTIFGGGILTLFMANPKFKSWVRDCFYHTHTHWSRLKSLTSPQRPPLSTQSTHHGIHPCSILLILLRVAFVHVPSRRPLESWSKRYPIRSHAFSNSSSIPVSLSTSTPTRKSVMK